MTVEYVSNFESVIGAIARGKPRAAARTASKLAQYAAAKSAVATGSARASWYARGMDVDEYPEKLAEATALNPKAIPLEPVDPPEEGSAVVAHAVLHPFFLEFGTIHMQAQPALQPAILEMQEELSYIFYGAIELELASVRTQN